MRKVAFSIIAATSLRIASQHAAAHRAWGVIDVLTHSLPELPVRPIVQTMMQPYLVRNKGGNLSGYSTLFSFIPELQLSVMVAWNGGANEFGASDGIYQA